ncbi:Smr/MutS family protein [Zhouia sp. PK063]|uniref:Smr/MutS family protein n=1 Tax=Zhouia sp. PK063 TaxID=3373602 RepID=UPI0037A78D77
MSFKIGDNIEFLDDILKGTVKKIVSNTTYIIETEDGFEMEVNSSEITLAAPINAIKVSNYEVAEIAENDVFKKKKTARVKPKERNLPAMEVDLHIHHLTASTKGMQNHDMLNLQLETAKRQLEFAIEKRIQKVVFIHGVGEGVLKLELEYLFSRYSNVKFYDADFKKYGFGATEVYIFQNY